MLVVISPAKTLDYETPAVTDDYTLPAYIPQSEELIARLRQLSPVDLAELMKISMKLAELNAQRYHHWTPEFTTANAKQAVLAMKGDVYTGLDAEGFCAEDFRFAQGHLRILSGLYGLLRPLDLMQPYRLEMGTRLSNRRGKDLYAFWGEQLTHELNRLLESAPQPLLINLASNEYFKSVKPRLLKARLIVPQFKEYKDGQYKMIGFYAKKARGMMARHIITQRLEDPEALKGFDLDGYHFQEALSNERDWVFSRGD